MDSPQLLYPINIPPILFWNGEEIEVIATDNKPFVARVNHVESLLYEDHIRPIKMFGTSKHGGPEVFMFMNDQALDISFLYEESDRILETTLIIADEESVLNGSTIFEV